MSTVRTWQTESTSLEATLALAEEVGRQLKGGEVIVLQGDLGAGKTAFIRGLAKGMGSSDKVRSPSFTIGHQYHAGRLTLHHFDFYRLDEPGILRVELEEVLSDKQAVVAVEWAEIVDDVLPGDHLTIQVTPKDENTRELLFTYSQNLEHLVPANA